jgi:adenylosuccinate lyase
VPDGSGALFCPIEFRYGRAEFRELFSRESRLRRALRVEAAIAEAQGELGIIPAEAAAEIARVAAGGAVRLDRVDALEAELRHDVMAIVRALGEACGDAGRWVHFGATSADVTETALVLELDEALGILRSDLTTLGRVLIELARRHRQTAEVGRTHGQHAVPFSFGYKVAGMAAEVVRHRRRLDELRPRVTVGKVAGAVGTGAGFGGRAADVESSALKRLHLAPDEAPSQIVGRDRLAEMTNFLALVAGTAERLSTEIRNLQRTEIGEVSESFDERTQVGSSTMAQKRNPVVAENITSLARLVRAFALPSLENMVLWHERDLANSANERIGPPHALVLTDDILTKLADLFTHLRVDADRMAANLEMSGGTAMTESLMLTLTLRGLPRADAHEILRTLTGPMASGDSLLDRARRDPRITRLLSPPEIAEVLDPTTYVHAAAAKTDRLLPMLEAELARG